MKNQVLKHPSSILFMVLVGFFLLGVIVWIIIYAINAISIQIDSSQIAETIGHFIKKVKESSK